MYKQGRGLIIRTKPFNHLAVISILREVFFGSAWKSLAEQYCHCFTSTIETRSDEPEIPAAALVLVATCICFLLLFWINILCYSCLFQIHSAIDDYSSGLCKKTDFNADLYEDVYNNHIEFLEHIKTASATKYHHLMAVSKLGGLELWSHVMPETAGYKTRLQLMCCALVWEPECLGIWRSGVVQKLLRDAEEV